jgi:antitoxin Phd
MTIDTNTVVSMTEANQNFSKVTRIADQYGRAVVFKNNVPRYLVIQFAIADQVEDAAKSEVLASASKIMDLYDEAFKELAK